jgi:outer membrane protein
MRRPFFALLLIGLAAPIAAQSPTSVGATLTIEDAIEIARRNNPAFQQQLNAQRRAGAALRTAYGGLLPSVDAGFGTSYREGRPQVFGGVAFGANSDVITSSYSVNFSAAYSLQSLLNPRQQSFTVDAVDADVAFRELTLRQQVTERYLLAQQASRRAVLQDSIVARQRLQLELAQVRVTVGSGTSLDVKRAEVALGQQELEAVRARNTAATELVRLLQVLAVPAGTAVQLTSELSLIAPTIDLNALLSEAKARNPNIAALRYREEAATVNRRRATGQYLPALRLSAGFGGFTNQLTDNSFAVNQAQSQVLGQRALCLSQDSLRVGAGLPSIGSRCNALVFTDADADRIRSANSTWPFDFSREPYTLSASLSLPLFNGFQREQQVQEASLVMQDARLALRDAELQLTSDITLSVFGLRTQWQVLELQRQTAAASREALQLAQEQYRVGTASFIDVATALNDYQAAEIQLLSATYEYQRVFSQLELLIARSLR